MYDDDPTGERASSSTWSVIEDDVRLIGSTIDDDVLSVASSRLTGTQSIASSSRSATAYTATIWST